MKIFMLTTIDNPFDPFTEWDEWLMYDNEHDYYSCNKLARFANTSDELTEEENNKEIENAIDEIILNDPTNMFIKVTSEED